MRFGVGLSQCRQQAGCLRKVEAQCTGLRVPGQGLSPEYAPALPAHLSPWDFLPLPPFFGDPPLLPPGIGSGKEAVCSRTFSETWPSLRAQWPPSTGYGLGSQARCPAPGLFLKGGPTSLTSEQLLPYKGGRNCQKQLWGRGQVRVTCAS